MGRLRHAVLALARNLGAFDAARARHAGHLPILCYHGFSMTDEHLFRPKLFMRAETFRRRMHWLRAHGYRVVGLAEGLRRLVQGSLDPGSVAITIDDGFRGTVVHAVPVLRELGFPATVYVTSYYVQHPNPVFRLAVQYIFWRTRVDRFDGSAFAPGLRPDLPTRGEAAERAMFALIDHAESSLGETERVALAERLGGCLGVDYGAIVRAGALSIMTPEQLAGLANDGVDVELHTHRHRLPRDEREIEREIADNRAVLEPIIGRPLVHFCYPSGVWDASQWQALSQLGVVSATTCEPGLNSPDAPMLGLTRLLDADDLDMLEFEAELSGLKHAMRSVLRRRGLRSGEALPRGA